MMRYMVPGVVAFSFLALIALSLSAQQALGRMGGSGAAQGEERGLYDPAQAEELTGDVVNTNDVDFNNAKISGAGIDLKTESQTIPVYLGPHIYVDLQNVRISVGDNVKVKGVKVMLDGQQVFIAGEIRKGNELLQLRDDNGAPLWAGKYQGGHRGSNVY